MATPVTTFVNINPGWMPYDGTNDSDILDYVAEFVAITSHSRSGDTLTINFSAPTDPVVLNPGDYVIGSNVLTAESIGVNVVPLTDLQNEA